MAVSQRRTEPPPLADQTEPDAAPSAIRRVLVVDDSRVQRRILAANLTRWGYDVCEADSGLQAMAIVQDRPVDLVLSDWMMPGMDGLEFCRAFRALPRDRYGYFILLTSKTDKSDVAAGLEVGADDFLAKPVDAAELRARILAGERILRMERELMDKNRLLAAALSELQGLYQALDQDLQEARKLQLTLVRDWTARFETADIALLLRPSGHVGGDLVGFFPSGPGRVAFFAIDVAGHGVTSAIMASRLAGALSADSPERNIALRPGGAMSFPPEDVAARLNRLVLEQMKVDHYFTIAYAEADLATGAVSLVQAGHPHPLLIRADGRIERVGAGGMPIGLIPGAAYDRIDLTMARGDRLFLMSDGITECADPRGEELGEDGLMSLMARHGLLSGPEFLDRLVAGLETHAGATEFRDDISGVVFDYRGP